MRPIAIRMNDKETRLFSIAKDEGISIFVSRKLTRRERFHFAMRDLMTKAERDCADSITSHISVLCAAYGLVAQTDEGTAALRAAVYRFVVESRERAGAKSADTMTCTCKRTALKALTRKPISE
jgi:inactivated superfamily I helicase